MKHLKKGLVISLITLNNNLYIEYVTISVAHNVFKYVDSHMIKAIRGDSNDFSVYTDV